MNIIWIGGGRVCLAERIRLCRLLNKMEEQKEYSQKLGLENVSTFHKKQINDTISK